MVYIFSLVVNVINVVASLAVVEKAQFCLPFTHLDMLGTFCLDPFHAQQRIAHISLPKSCRLAKVPLHLYHFFLLIGVFFFQMTKSVTNPEELGGLASQMTTDYGHLAFQGRMAAATAEPEEVCSL